MPSRRRGRASAALSIAIVLILLVASLNAATGPRASAVPAPRASPEAIVSGAVAAATVSLEHGGGPATASPWACGPARSAGTVRCTAPASAPRPATASVPGWRTEGAAPAPGGLLAYSLDDHAVIYLGSDNNGPYNTPVGETWSYSGGIWSDLNLSATPGVCWGPYSGGGAALTEDPVDHGLLYLGGANCSSEGQTWLYQAAGWTQLHPAASPPLRRSAALAYDAGISAVVMFGGDNLSCGASAAYLCNDTWSFAAGVWTNLTATAGTPPPARDESGLVYDPASGQILLFGGNGRVANNWTIFNDTWGFNGTSWNLLAPSASPPPMMLPLLTFDVADGYVLLAGGSNLSCYGTHCVNQTWKFANGTWSRLSAIGPSASSGPWSITYDGSDREAVMFGGYNAYGVTAPGDTWVYSGGAWTNQSVPTPPGTRSYASLADDPADGYVVLFGGYSYRPGVNAFLLNDTWTYRAGVWTDLALSVAPSARYGAALAYDASDGYLLLFGGESASCPALPNQQPVCHDSWEFLAGRWTQLSPTVSPPGRSQASMVYDGFDGYVLLFGGTNELGINDTWAYHAGLWSNLTGNLTVSPTGDPIDTLAMTYDAGDGHVLLFGVGRDTSPWLRNETWAFRAGVWTNLTGTIGAVAPPPTMGAGFVYDPTLNESLLFGGCVAADCTSLTGATWIFAGSSWTEAFPPTSPSARDGPSLVYDASEGYPLLFGGRTAQSTMNDAWIWTNVTPAGLGIASFSVSPAHADVGQAVSISVSVVPVSAGLNYSYFGLPSGCATQNRSAISCTPTTSGTFSVGVVVQDTGGNRTSARATLVVVPLPSVASFAATPDPVSLDGLTVLTAVGSGGWGALAYAYSGLPPGCTTQTVPALPCHPTQSGNYTVTVLITDALGGNGSASTTVEVTSVGAGPGPRINSFAANPSSIVLGNSTTITTGLVSGGSAEAFSYTGLPAGCVSGNRSSLPCSPTVAGTYTLTVTVTDPAGLNASVSSGLTVYPVGGGTGAAITAFAASPGIVEVGQSTVLSVLAAGGVGWLSFRFANLPPGCQSANVSSLACTPTSAGVYQIYVVVRDGVGNSAGVQTPLLVTTPSGAVRPSISAFLAQPGTIHVGENALLIVLASGASTLRYDYRGLPTGCTSMSTPTLNCTPTGAGSFNISVVVTDTGGRNASSYAGLTVLPATVHTPPGGGGNSSGSSVLDLIAAHAATAIALVLGLLIALPILWWEHRRRRLRAEGEALVRAIGDDADRPTITRED